MAQGKEPVTGAEWGLLTLVGGLAGASLGASLAVRMNRRDRERRQAVKSDRYTLAAEHAAEWREPVHVSCLGTCEWMPVPGYLLNLRSTYVMQRLIPAGVPLDEDDRHEARALTCIRCQVPVRPSEVAFPPRWGDA